MFSHFLPQLCKLSHADEREHYYIRTGKKEEIKVDRKQTDRKTQKGILSVIALVVF